MTRVAGSAPSLRAVGRSALILMAGSLTVQLLSIARELFVAAQVGLSRELDAFLIALVLPLTLSGVLTSGTVTALVPAYLEARSARGLATARRLAGTVIGLVAIGSVIVAIALSVFAATAVGILGPGLSHRSQTDAAAYLRILAPVAFFAAAGGVLTSICQAEERFSALAVASLVGPLVALLALIVLWDSLGLMAYALASLIGPATTCAVLAAYTLRAGIAPVPGLRFRGLELRALARHAGPLTLSGAILQLNVLADRAIASLIAPGAVSALRFGEILVRTPITAIAPAWSAALYPAQVRAAGDRNTSRLGETTGRSIAYAAVAFIPVAALVAALAPLLAEAAYLRGAFTTGDVSVTAAVVAAFAPLILVLMVSPVLVGAHNARRRGVILLVTGSLNVVLNFTLDLALGKWLGVAGIALSSSVTSVLLVLFLAFRLAHAEADFPIRSLLRTSAHALAAISIPALAVALIARSGLGHGSATWDLILLVVLGVVALAAYALIATRTGLREVTEVVRLATRRLRQLVPIRPPAR